MQEREYPDVIAIRKDIEYQELSFEKNTEGKKLVYLIGRFVRKGYQGSHGDKTEEDEIVNTTINKRINLILVITKKEIYLQETLERYQTTIEETN